MILFLCIFIFVMSQPETNWQRKRRENPPPVRPEDTNWSQRRWNILDLRNQIPDHQRSAQYAQLVSEMFQYYYEKDPFRAMMVLYEIRPSEGRNRNSKLDQIFDKLVNEFGEP